MASQQAGHYPAMLTQTNKPIRLPRQVAPGSAPSSIDNRTGADWPSVLIAPVEQFLLTERKRIRLTDRRGKLVWGTRITVQSVFDSSIEDVWARVIQPIAMLYVAQGKVNFVPVPVATLGNVWQEGRVYRFKRYLCGHLSAGFHTIRIERIDPKRHLIHSRESGAPLIQTWDHLIRLQATLDGKTLYTDCIDLYAGLATPLLAGWVTNYCKHRQRRWWAVVKACSQ